MRFPRRKGPAGPVLAVRRTGQPGPRFNYELFNCNNCNIRYWSWNYRGCWPIQMPEYCYSPLPLRNGARVAGGLSHGHGTYLKPPRSRQSMPLRALYESCLGTPLRIGVGLRPVASPDPGCFAGNPHQFAGARLVKSTLSGVSKD